FIFEEITRVVVQEVDVGGDMIAVRRILDADRFHRCSLVRGKRNFWGHQYHGPDLTLEDVLERREGEGPFDWLRKDAGLRAAGTWFLILDMVVSKGMLTVKLPKELTIAGTFHGSHKQRVKILETRIPQQYLDSLEHGEPLNRLSQPGAPRVSRDLNCCLYREVLELRGFQKHEGEGAGHGERCAKLPQSAVAALR
uniref:Gasdermin pore forming domain-containing protein n=1 Tax=Ailuropoda melanoleuca TaxID=9646 RepID=G1LTG9_AILME